jgi:hypothetical protein
MEAQQLDSNIVIAILKTNLNFKSKYDRYNLNKKIKKNDMSDITTQLAHLYCKSIISDNNISSMNTDSNNDELLKQIEDLKKENKKLKKQNKQLTDENEKLKEETDDEKVSKKKYQHEVFLKNRNWNELNEYKSKCTILEEKNESLEHRLKQIKSKYNISDEDESKNEVMELDLSSDEEEDEDREFYQHLHTKQIKEEEEKKAREEYEFKAPIKTERDILIEKKKEYKQFENKLNLITSEYEKDIDESKKKKLGKEGKSLNRKMNLLKKVIEEMQQEEEDRINELIEIHKKGI